MASAISDDAKLCLSVLTDPSIALLHSRQTEETIKLLEKYVGHWSNTALAESNESEKMSGKTLKKGNKKNDFLNDEFSKTPNLPTKLTAVPGWLQRFSEVSCTAIDTKPCSAEKYYTVRSEDGEGSKPDEACILLSFAYLIQAYLSCTVSMSETNLLNANKQHQVCLSFAAYHLRYQLLLQQVPFDMVTKNAQAIESIKTAHVAAKGQAVKLAEKVSSMKTIGDLRDLITLAKTSASSTHGHGGTTEQAHSLKEALQTYDWSENFTDSTIAFFVMLFYFMFECVVAPPLYPFGM